MKATVLSDRLGQILDDGTVVRHVKGDTVDLSKDDYDRHLKSGAIAPSSSKAAKEAAAEAESESETTPPAETPETPPTAEELEKGNDRDQLNAMAKDAGVEDADKLPNKAAVAEAIVAARG